MKLFASVDMTAPDAMRRIYSDRSVADMYIDGLAEGLNPEDTKYFKSLCNNMLDEITGAGPFANSGGTLSMLCENTSAAFMPKAKVLFPMFRFTWPRLHIREICTVIPMDSPEIIRYFFKAVAKNTDDSIIPLPSYSPIGNGIAIGTASRPKEVSLPGTVDLLNSVGLDNKSASLEKMFTIVGWEGTDGTGAAITEAKSPAPVFVVVDADGKFEMQVDCDPDGNSGTAIIDVVTGFVDVRRLAA